MCAVFSFEATMIDYTTSMNKDYDDDDDDDRCVRTILRPTIRHNNVTSYRRSNSDCKSDVFLFKLSYIVPFACFMFIVTLRRSRER